MDNFNLIELMDLAEAYVGPMVDAIYRRLMDRDFALEDTEVVMLLTALINILGHDNPGDRPTEVLLMVTYGERGVIDRPKKSRRYIIETMKKGQDVDWTEWHSWKKSGQ